MLEQGQRESSRQTLRRAVRIEASLITSVRRELREHIHLPHTFEHTTSVVVFDSESQSSGDSGLIYRSKNDHTPVPASS